MASVFSSLMPPPYGWRGAGQGRRSSRFVAARVGYVAAMTRFPFAFAPSYRLPALVFGITPLTTYVEVDDEALRVRVGPWSLRTPRSNVAGVDLTGDYGFVKTAGPP